jgi:hypothetical protein
LGRHPADKINVCDTERKTAKLERKKKQEKQKAEAHQKGTASNFMDYDRKSTSLQSRPTARRQISQKQTTQLLTHRQLPLRLKTFSML